MYNYKIGYKIVRIPYDIIIDFNKTKKYNIFKTNRSKRIRIYI